MPYPATIQWLDNKVLTLRSDHDLSEALDQYEHDSLSDPEHPLLALITDSDDDAAMIGVAREGAFFEFTGNEIKTSRYYRNYVSVGSASTEKVVSFWFLIHHSDFRAENLIDVQKMNAAVHHWLETRELSNEVKWLDCSSRPDRGDCQRLT